MRIMVVVGTRPEVVKLAPVIHACRQQSGWQVMVCATGQHKGLLQQALDIFALQPDIDLSIMQANQTLSGLTARLMEALSAVLTAHRPDYVIVQGDTTSALMGGLAAFYQHIPVAHVEAGLRTHRLDSPFPEELNRQLLARMTRLHFAPTQRAAEDLQRENIPADHIYVTGNTVVDALHLIRQRWQQRLPVLPASLAHLSPSTQSPWILVTTHRRESFGEPLADICKALRTLCQRYAHCQFILPVHPNPMVRDAIFAALSDIRNVNLVEPLDYETLLYILSQCCLVLTDSGGIQEEAPSFGVPAIVLRDYTERREGIDAGFAHLTGTQPARIIAAAEAWLNAPEKRKALLQQPNPYGDGTAANQIAAILANALIEQCSVALDHPAQGVYQCGRLPITNQGA